MIRMDISRDSALLPRLRVGSVLTTRGGTRYRVIAPVIEVAANGGAVPTLVLEKTAEGGAPQSVVMPVGRLANLLRQGGKHKPGNGPDIDWQRVERRAMTEEGTFLRARPLTGRKSKEW